MFLIKPGGQFIKGKDRVNLLAFLGFLFFGHAGADKYRFSPRNTALDIGAVCLHRRHYRCQIAQQRRIIPPNEQINRWTAGGNNKILVRFHYHAVIFPFHHRCAQGSFFRIIKAQFFQGLPQFFYSAAGIIGNEGRGQAGYHRCAALQHHTHLAGLIHNLLGLLRAYHKALPAHNALILDDIGLIAGEANGLDRTMADTLIAIFTVGFFQRQTFHSNVPPRRSGFIACSGLFAPFLQRMRGFLPA